MQFQSNFGFGSLCRQTALSIYRIISMVIAWQKQHPRYEMTVPALGWMT
jgi:hypothetical protein